MSIIIKSGSSGYLADVDANKNLKATGPLVENQAGFATMSSEKDTGEVTGERYCLSPEVSEDYRLRVGMDTVLDNETFNYAAQNTGKYRYHNTTMTTTWSSGYMTTNGSGITTVSTSVTVSTYRSFPIISTAPLYCEINAAFTNQCPTNTVIDFGMFIPTTAATPHAPVDGAYFRMNPAGLMGVLNYNGTETQTGEFLSFVPVANQNYHFVIVISEGVVEFWIDDVLYAEIETQTGNGQPCMSGSLPFSVRHAIVGNAASAVVQFKVSDYTVALGDISANKRWSHQMAGMGAMSYQGQAGQASLLQTVSYPLSTLPTAAALSQSAARATGLGGQFAFNIPNLAATDWLLTAYQSPVPTAVLTGRSLYITGVTISDYVVTALGTPAAGINIHQYNIIFGAGPGTIPAITVVADTAVLKCWRTIPLGFVSYPAAAVAGTVGTPQQISMDFGDSPICVSPSEWIGTSVRIINGPATAAGAIGGIVTFRGYWE